MSETTPVDALRAEHEVVLGKMRELAEAVLGLRAEEGKQWREVGEGLRSRAGELREALVVHFRKEEDGLFPDVIGMVAKGAPRVDILSSFFGAEADDDLKAHTLLRSRLKDVAALLDGAEEAGECDSATAARLGTVVGLAKDLLERHVKKEHELVFPMIERLLDDSQMAAVGERLEKIDRAARAGRSG